jgi:hypothetical protein
MPLEFELGYDPTDIACENVLAIGRDGLGIDFLIP